jgi:thioredoxin-related protein
MPEKSKLDTIANIAIILVCIIAAVILIRNNFFPGSSRPAGAPPEAKKGETYAELRQVVPAGTDRALVLALSPTCHFCNDSMPFYKQLLDQRNQKGSAVKVIAAVPGDDVKSDEEKNFTSHGIQPDSIIAVDFKKIRVPGTPTVLLVDNQGKILDVWVGKLDGSREREVLARL